jgi:RNA polymerase subunit RPABC4/transcription elongation factor Spt4
MAVLCMDCEMIAEPLNDCCPVCGSRALILLSRALGRAMDIERIARLDVDADSAYAVKSLADADETPTASA